MEKDNTMKKHLASLLIISVVGTACQNLATPAAVGEQVLAVRSFLEAQAAAKQVHREVLLAGSNGEDDQ